MKSEVKLKYSSDSVASRRNQRSWSWLTYFGIIKHGSSPGIAYYHYHDFTMLKYC